MTIRKGEPWGEAVEPPPELLLLDSDAAVAEAFDTADRHPLGARRGDLARTMGGGTDGRFDGTVVRAPIDVLEVHADDRTYHAVAHVVARRAWWRGEVVLVMNAQFLGEYDVAPRSHPNDGRADVLQVDRRMGLRARLQARSRARTGTHLPHPMLHTSSPTHFEVRFRRPLDLWVDGVERGRVTDLRVDVLPDALTIHA